MHGEIRIIGGQWRGRKLKVPHEARPTPDRVRETLFNWLTPVIHGAYCLDAFAGSGVLGFEAISRGAAHVMLVDQSRSVIETLKAAAERFKTTAIDCVCAPVPDGLPSPKTPYDIVFLDPPYHSELLLPTCFYLEAQHFLAREAYIYIESNEVQSEQTLPPHWTVLKTKKAGQVVYQLVLREKA